MMHAEVFISIHTSYYVVVRREEYEVACAETKAGTPRRSEANSL